MTSSLREPLHQIALPTYWPRGEECVLEYNGFVFNDWRRADRICITKIGGLDDPDVIDSRDNNPDRDGETPFDAFYGGRTLTLTGYVTAGNLNTMRMLYSSLKDAFDNLTEAPLRMRWLDWVDTFIDSLALSDYGFDAGTGTITVNADDTGLTPSSTANKQIFISLIADGSVSATVNGGETEMIVGFSDPTVTALVVGPTFRRTAANSHLRVVYEHASTRLALYKRVAGVDTLLDNVSITLSASTNYYIVARAEGGVITYAVWNGHPESSTSFVLATKSFTLSGGDLTLFPAIMAGLRSRFGIFWTPGSTSGRIFLLDAAMINPGDAQIACRKVSKMEGEETQVDGRWKRDFMLTLRASDPRLVARKSTLLSLTTASSTLTFPAGGAGLPFIAPDVDIVFGNLITPNVVNLGRSPAATVITFIGPLSNATLLNQTTGDRCGFTGSLVAGETLSLNSSTRKVIDQLGASQYDRLSDDTTWITLARGVNKFIMGADAATGSVTMSYRHSSR